MAMPAARVSIVPLTDDRIAFQHDGVEKAVWNFARRYPRPHLFPLIGPSGRSVTRMGHPGDHTHDHHRSIWFAHRDIAGVNFWEDRPANTQQVRQENWVHYQDGEAEALAAVRLGWFDAHAVKLMQQDLLIVWRPLPAGESELELQSVFTTALDPLPIGKTNFGFLAVRVAREISAIYGGGRLTSSEAAAGEKAIFGKPAKWMDYSGPTTADKWEGITYFDHPANPHQPTSWHVRDDGWMCASACMNDGFALRKGESITLRYLLHIHAGEPNAARANARHKAWSETPEYVAVTDMKPYKTGFRRKV
jgi:hypothetical protein